MSTGSQVSDWSSLLLFCNQRPQKTLDLQFLSLLSWVAQMPKCTDSRGSSGDLFLPFQSRTVIFSLNQHIFLTPTTKCVRAVRHVTPSTNGWCNVSSRLLEGLFKCSFFFFFFFETLLLSCSQRVLWLFLLFQSFCRLQGSVLMEMLWERPCSSRQASRRRRRRGAGRSWTPHTPTLNWRRATSYFLGPLAQVSVARWH